jgi:hypothetical protein
MSHVCIDATTCAVADFGYHCVAVSDVCTTRDLQIENHPIAAQRISGAFMAALDAACADVSPLADVLACLTP